MNPFPPIPSDDAAYALLRHLGADRMPHGNGRTLFEHLVGLGAVVRAWGAPERVRKAALFHSVYGTSAYRDAAAASSRRDDVRAVIGDDAEGLSFAFGAVDRSRFGAAVAAMRDFPEPCTLATRFDERVAYTRRDVVDLAILGTANEAEQTCAPDGSPAPWRIWCAPLASALARWPATALSDFVRRALPIDERTETEAVAAYATAVRLLRDGEEAGATAAFMATVESPAMPAEPLVWIADLVLARGDVTAAARAAGEARIRLLAWGTAWDKRLTWDAWNAIADALERGERPDALRDVLNGSS